MSNLLFLCDTYAPNIGGSEQVLLDLARGCAEGGHAVVVFAPSSRASREVERRFDEGEPYVILRSGLWRRLHALGGSRSGLASRLSRAAVVLYLFWRVRAMAGLETIVVGHVLPAGNVAAAVKRLRGVRVVVLTYGEDVAMYVRSPRMRSLLEGAFEAADAITCLTRDSAGDIAGLVPQARDKVCVCPPPADPLVAEVPAERADELRARLGLEGKRVMLTVARLVPRKGIDVALHALAILAGEFPDLAYVIVGTGFFMPALRALAESLGVTDRVFFEGEVRPDCRAYYRMCDLFVMPNRTMESGEREGYGIVFAEAGLAGKPVVAGRSGGACDAVADGETGLLVDPGDASAVAAAVRKLLNDPDLAARMGEAGRRRAQELSSPQATRRRFLDVLDGLSREGRAAPTPPA